MQEVTVPCYTCYAAAAEPDRLFADARCPGDRLFSARKAAGDEVFRTGHQVATFGVTLLMIVPGVGDTWAFEVGKGAMQKTFSLPWIPSFNIDYLMGMDGISFPLVILTTFITMVSMGASWPIDKNIKAYCILFLLLETGILGVFLALDFFLFYVFWEVMLLPMYFLIGVWGGPRREYAAIKFFLYTLFGSVLMLIAILMLYFASDLEGAFRRSIGRHARRLADAGRGRPRGRAGSDSRRQRPAAHVQHPGPDRNWASTPRSSRGICCWAKAWSGGRFCCCSSASSSRCRRCRFTLGCPTRTSRPPRRSR